MLTPLGVAVLLSLPRIVLAPLLFETLPDGRGGEVLFIRDCGLGGMPRDKACEPWQEHFYGQGRFKRLAGDSVDYPGDAAVLRRVLGSGRKFSEVWLLSYGGNLQAGIEIGRLLRANSMTVRVPGWRRVSAVSDWPEPIHEVACISSCTVAFMGGLFRYLDPDASYQVHSGSWVGSGVDEYQLDLVRKGDMQGLGQLAYRRARSTALQLLTHFQNTLLRMAGRPTENENDDQIRRWASQLSRNPYSADQAARDLRQISAEGLGSIQDLIMRMERDAMRWSVEDLRAALPRLGARAAPALRMLEAMYDVSIKETAVLSRETMLAMGYLTQELDQPAAIPR